MNSSTTLVKLIDDNIDLTVAEKIAITVMWIMSQTFGNFLVIGLIQFERLGGDPMK